MNISEKEIEGIVRQVVEGLSAAPAPAEGTVNNGKKYRGVFENMEDAIDAAYKAQKILYDISHAEH